jgi:hypothetical protein
MGSPYCKGQDYFDTLLGKLYVNQSVGEYIIGVDFNARIGDLTDFIEGTDDVQERNVIDEVKNTAGDFLVDFLIQSESCVLNGRSTGIRDFTVVNNLGKSEVDYIIIPKEKLGTDHTMDILSPTVLVDRANIKAQCKCKIDHSLLCMDITNWLANSELKKVLKMTKAKT